MMYQVIIKPLAQKDIIAIMSWYKEQLSGLEKKFATELKKNINLIIKKPLIGPVKYNGFRVLVLKTFPYLLYYTFENKTIYVHAVIAAKQDQENILANKNR